jgi:hypothetical protein
MLSWPFSPSILEQIRPCGARKNSPTYQCQVGSAEGIFREGVHEVHPEAVCDYEDQVLGLTNQLAKLVSNGIGWNLWCATDGRYRPSEGNRIWFFGRWQYPAPRLRTVEKFL